MTCVAIRGSGVPCIYRCLIGGTKADLSTLSKSQTRVNSSTNDEE